MVDSTTLTRILKLKQLLTIPRLLSMVTILMQETTKAYNKTKTPVEPAPEAPKGPTAEELLTEIRDSLKK